MNSFRKAILSGQGLHKGDPVVHDKKSRGAETDDLSSVEVPRSETRSQNHRDDDRHRLDQESATARFDGEEHHVDLINLSGGGAMIRADFAPRLWERVDLIFDEGAKSNAPCAGCATTASASNSRMKRRSTATPKRATHCCSTSSAAAFRDLAISMAKPEREPVDLRSPLAKTMTLSPTAAGPSAATRWCGLARSSSIMAARKSACATFPKMGR